MFSKSDIESVSNSHAAPLYHQLYSLLRQKIESGELRHGTLLPSEFALAALFQVSRITAKRAFDDLQHAGLVDRRRGRGTQVNHLTPPRMLRAPLTGMLESLNVMGQETQVEVLSFTRVMPPSAVSEALKLLPGAQVDRAVRLRKNGGMPFAYYVSHTILLGAGFSARSLAGASRLQVFKQMGVRLAEVDQVLTACAATPEVATALQLSVGAPLLSLTRIYTDSDKRPIDHLHGLYRPDRFQYHMHLAAPERRRT